MADYFTYFSVVVPLRDAAQQEYAVELAAKAAGCCLRDEDAPIPDGIPPDLADVLHEWRFETEAQDDTGIWLHSQEGGVDAACGFIQHLLKRFDPEGRVEFEWSHDCSKPRVGAYGGGAAVVTADKILTMSTSEWLRQQTDSLPEPKR
jgi:hypothetical protein